MFIALYYYINADIAYCSGTGQELSMHFPGGKPRSEIHLNIRHYQSIKTQAATNLHESRLLKQLTQKLLEDFGNLKSSLQNFQTTKSVVANQVSTHHTFQATVSVVDL